MISISALDSRETDTYPEGLYPHPYGVFEDPNRSNLTCPRSYASVDKDQARSSTPPWYRNDFRMKASQVELDDTAGRRSHEHR